MFCQQCGNEIPDGSRFCTSCGAPAPAADANDDVKDNYRFKIVKNGSREAYNIIPKGGTKSLYKTDGNWNTADISLGDINNDLSCWNFVAKGNYTKTSPPFIISSLDGEKHYYKIQNNNNQALFMLPGGSNVYTYSSTADMNDMVWFFVKADIDDPYLDYYFIFHPKNNKMMCFTRIFFVSFQKLQFWKIIIYYFSTTNRTNNF